MLEIIKGRAGSGKTHYCLKWIVDALKNDAENEIVMIVPEHDTFNMECRLMEQSGGFINAQISGFKRYAYRVLAEHGVDTGKNLSALGKKLLLTLAINEKKAELTALAAAAGKQGFADLLLKLFADLLTAGIDAKAWQEAIDRLPQGAKKAKMQDIALLYTVWQEKRNMFAYDENDYSRVLLPLLPSSIYSKDASVIIDGFQWFSQQEWCVIEKWLETTRHIIVSLPEDEGDSLTFAESRKTLDKLRVLAQRCGVTVVERSLTQNVRFGNRELVQLENIACDKEVIKSEASDEKTVQKDAGIHIYAADDKNKEIDFVVSEVKRLCREEKYQYRDIAILVQDENYGWETVNALSREGVAVYYDKEKSLTDHPLSEMLQSLLVLTEYRKWDYMHIFRFLKSGLCNISERECDVLENYVLQYGILGKTQWLKSAEWKYGSKENPELCEQSNTIRKRAFKEVKIFLAQLSKVTDFKGFCHALYHFLTTMSVPSQLEELAVEAEKDGNTQESEEHRHIWNYCIDLLDEIVAVAGDTAFCYKENIGFEAVKDILMFALQEVKIKIVQPSLDYVMVSSLEKSRGIEKKVIILCGAEDGVLPKAVNSESFLSEQEKDSLSMVGMELPDSRELSCLNAIYAAYLAVTRAQEQYIFTFSRNSNDGTKVKPALWLQMLNRFGVMVHRAEEHTISSDLLYRILTKNINALEQLPAVEPIWAEKARKFRELGSQWNCRAKLLPYLLRAGIETEGETSFSISKLQSYFACPFNFFATYVLSLQERRVKGLKMVDIGDLLHKAIEIFMSEQKGKLLLLTVEDAEVKARQLIAEATLLSWEDDDDGAEIMRQQAVQERISRRLAKFLCHLTALAQILPYGQSITEKQFTLQGGYETLSKEEKYLLRGKIDRVDSWEKDGTICQLAIDYKTNKGELDLAEVYYGVRLQLPVYLLALKKEAERRGCEWLPAGLLYYGVNPAIVTDEQAMNDEELRKQQWAKMKLKGVLLDDQQCWQPTAEFAEFIADLKTDKEGNIAKDKSKAFWQAEEIAAMMEFADKKMQDGLKKISNGEIEAVPVKKAGKPDTACTYCRHAAVCFFEAAEEKGYKIMRKVEKEELIAGRKIRGTRAADKEGKGDE